MLVFPQKAFTDFGTTFLHIQQFPDLHWIHFHELLTGTAVYQKVGGFISES